MSDAENTDAPPSLPDEMFLVDVPGEDGAPDRATLSFSRSPTVLLTFAANRYTRALSRSHQKAHGIGAMDWRMLVMLTREPGATVTRASEVMGLDKGAVSRSLQRIEGLGLAAAGELHANGRSRGWRLTAAGEALHDTVLEEALARQRHLFEGASPEEVRDFCAMLTRFLDRLETLPER